jgi:hypothetical protein
MMKTRFLILSLATLCLSAVPASAAMFTLNHDAAMMLWDVFENPENATSALTFVTDDTVTYGQPMSGEVGFVGTLYTHPADPYYPFAQMGLGANFWGTSSTGSGATTAQVIGTALGTAPTNSLVGFDTYTLYIENDNNSEWSVNIFLNTGYVDQGETNNWYQNGWTVLLPGQSVTLSIDLTSVANLNHVTNIGFQVGGDLTNLSGNPSDPDIYHISVVPVPAALLLGMLGLSAAGFKLRRFA